MSALENTPLKRLHVLALLDHDGTVMLRALVGGESLDANRQLAVLVRDAGKLAGDFGRPRLVAYSLKRIYGFTAGWLMALGAGNVQNRIAAERERQEALLRAGKFFFTCASPTASDARKLRVLVEEIGEVAEAVDNLEQAENPAADNPQNKKSREQTTMNCRAHLIEELVQVAAVAVAWLEAMEVQS